LPIVDLPERVIAFQSTLGNGQLAMARILHEALIFVRKEVSTARFAELTKLYIPLTDSLRPFWVQSALGFGV